MRVLLVDDNRLMLEGLQNLLDAHGNDVVGMAADGLESVALARELKPDVILMDIRMPRCNGLEATRLIKAEMPDAVIIMLTTSTEDDDLFEAIKSGACGYLLKSMDTDDLVAALDQARQGTPPFHRGWPPSFWMSLRVSVAPRNRLPHQSLQRPVRKSSGAC